jgi:hypothetical protein
MTWEIGPWNARDDAPRLRPPNRINDGKVSRGTEDHGSRSSQTSLGGRSGRDESALAMRTVSSFETPIRPKRHASPVSADGDMIAKQQLERPRLAEA